MPTRVTIMTYTAVASTGVSPNEVMKREYYLEQELAFGKHRVFSEPAQTLVGHLLKMVF